MDGVEFEGESPIGKGNGAGAGADASLSFSRAKPSPLGSPSGKVKDLIKKYGGKCE